MAREERLGDKFPGSKNPKWGSMVAGESHLSDEWHNLEHSTPHMSEKWEGMKPSAPQMSEKWVNIETGGTEFSDRWHEMKQEGREDPYSMFPSAGDRTQPFKPMAKIKPDNRVERKDSTTGESGEHREI